MIKVFLVGFSANKGGVEAYISNLCGNLDKTQIEITYSLPEMNMNGKIWKCHRKMLLVL